MALTLNTLMLLELAQLDPNKGHRLYQVQVIHLLQSINQELLLTYSNGWKISLMARRRPCFLQR